MSDTHPTHSLNLFLSFRPPPCLTTLDLHHRQASVPVLPAAIGQPVMTPAASVPATVPMVVVPITTPSGDGGSAGNLGDNVGDGMAFDPAIHVDYSGVSVA